MCVRACVRACVCACVRAYSGVHSHVCHDVAARSRSEWYDHGQRVRSVYVRLLLRDGAAPNQPLPHGHRELETIQELVLLQLQLQDCAKASSDDDDDDDDSDNGSVCFDSDYDDDT